MTAPRQASPGLTQRPRHVRNEVEMPMRSSYIMNIGRVGHDLFAVHARAATTESRGHLVRGMSWIPAVPASRGC